MLKGVFKMIFDETRKARSCDECPYKLGVIKTLVDPCTQCSNRGRDKTGKIKILKKNGAEKGSK